MGKQSKSRHREAAKRHDRQAREHDNAARVWLRRGDSVRAGFEQRAAKLERELAELERDHAAYEARKHAVVSTRGKDMRVAGVEIRDGAAAQLACLLHKNGEHSLAFHLGHAIGHLHDHLALTESDRRIVSRVLVGCPPELADSRLPACGRPRRD